ncbi:reverse transcriptase domain-containing protein [Tanacetum coccineum]
MARIMTITHSGMTPEAIEELITRRVEETLVAQEANHNAELIDENESQNRHDNDTGSGGNGNHGNNNGDGNQNRGNRDARGNAPVARVCTYKDFLNYQPRNFSGTKGVVGLARWFEKMESVLRISNCPPNSQVKFATCTFLDGALAWWNSHVQTISIDEAYEMSWKDLMNLMIKVYCPRNEIHKLENELWNLCVKGTDVAGYT